MSKQSTLRANKKANFERFATSELLDLTGYFHNRVKQDRATADTREAWDIVVEILKERGI